MFTQDFICRQIALFTAAIARILGHINSSQYQDASTVIEQSMEELTGLNVHIVKQMTDSGLLELCDTVHGLDCEKLFFLAELFALEGDVLAAQNNSSESKYSYQRALYLYNEFSTHCSEKGIADLPDKIHDLEEKVQ